ALHGPLAAALRGHISAAEIAALRHRAEALLDNPVMPTPDRRRPIPWPAF
ncbi:MAG TPA: phosphatidylinositol kinase, partial [Mycobacterium sp.]|nr:phosphatidylinositol kinase [Mycobacterium sp.]